MATRPLQPCGHPGCPALVERGLCADHARAAASSRPSRWSPRTQRDPEWDRVRRDYIAAHRSCAICGARATQVHHIVARADGGTHDPSNLVALCARCHAPITARQGAAAANRQRRAESRRKFLALAGEEQTERNAWGLPVFSGEFSELRAPDFFGHIREINRRSGGDSGHPDRMGRI